MKKKKQNILVQGEERGIFLNPLVSGISTGQSH